MSPGCLSQEQVPVASLLILLLLLRLQPPLHGPPLLGLRAQEEQQGKQGPPARTALPLVSPGTALPLGSPASPPCLSTTQPSMTPHLAPPGVPAAPPTSPSPTQCPYHPSLSPRTPPPPATCSLAPPGQWPLPRANPGRASALPSRLPESREPPSLRSWFHPCPTSVPMTRI